jgi:hypothetical protein
VYVFVPCIFSNLISTEEKNIFQKEKKRNVLCFTRNNLEDIRTIEKRTRRRI